MYLFLSDKKTQKQDLLWSEIKEKSQGEYRALTESLSEYISDSGKKNYDERVSVAILLCSIIVYLKRKGVVEKIGALKKGEHGKPYLDGGDIKFNISHTDGEVAIAVSRDCEVGVDIEEKISPERSGKLEKRFFPGINLFEKTVEKSLFEKEKNVNYLEAYRLENGEFSPVNLLFADDSFTAKWTACEAVMKCDGRGFAALYDINELAQEMKIKSFIYEKCGQKIYISVALR